MIISTKASWIFVPLGRRLGSKNVGVPYSAGSSNGGAPRLKSTSGAKNSLRLVLLSTMTTNSWYFCVETVIWLYIETMKKASFGPNNNFNAALHTGHQCFCISPQECCVALTLVWSNMLFGFSLYTFNVFFRVLLGFFLSDLSLETVLSKLKHWYHF